MHSELMKTHASARALIDSMEQSRRKSKYKENREKEREETNEIERVKSAYDQYAMCSVTRISNQTRGEKKKQIAENT